MAPRCVPPGLQLRRDWDSIVARLPFDAIGSRAAVESITVVARRRVVQPTQQSDVPASAGLVRVEAIEMSGDDRYRNGQRQHSGDGARGADQSPRRTDGHLVAVADRRHGDDRPPERVRDAVHLRVVAAELGVVDGAREDEQRDEQGDQEQAESFEAGLERHHEHLTHSSAANARGDASNKRILCSDYNYESISIIRQLVD